MVALIIGIGIAFTIPFVVLFIYAYKCDKKYEEALESDGR